MALDINSPVDSVQIADLPRYIRETRAAITTTGVTGARFETGVLTGDAVYLDSVNNVWRRSLAGDPTRGKFHGFADIDQSLVVIWGFFTSQAWAFADGATIYVSGSDLGALTDIDTGIAVGVCIAGDTILIDSQISSSFTALRDEIAAARDGAVDLHTKLETMDAARGAIANEITAARDGAVDLHTKLETMDAAHGVIANEITAARDGAANLHTKLEAMDAARGLVADEITAARGGAATLANRLSLIDSSVGTVTEEVEVSRGDAATLGQRLDVSLNPDGSLKTTTSVSNFATESAAILYVNSTTFTVEGNKTAIYVANRTIRCNSSPALVGYVSSSSYAAGTGLTTVVVTGVTVPVSLSTIEYSFHPNEMPRMAHSGLIGILGADPSSSDVTTNKHVSNNQLKVLTDGKQPLDATLTALAGLATSANKIILATGADAFSMIPFNSPAQNIGAAADVAAVRGVLGLGNAALKNVGTGSGDVSAGNHAHSGVYQPLDTELTALAGLVSAANKAPYFTGSGVAALMDVSAFARTILDDSDASTTLSTLGVTAFAKTILDDSDASTTLSTLGVSTFAKTLLDDANAATARTTLGALQSSTIYTTAIDWNTLTTPGLYGIYAASCTNPPIAGTLQWGLLVLQPYNTNNVIQVACRGGTADIYMRSKMSAVWGSWAKVGAQVSPKIISATRAMDAASGNVDYTGLGFQPSAVIAICGASPASGISYGSIGFDDGTNRMCLTRGYDTMVMNFNASYSLCMLSAPSAGQTGTMSMLTDGVRIAWEKIGSPAAATPTVQLLCWK